MIPVFCKVKHDPDNGTYGDCVRAAIASMLELDSEYVPHFFHDGCDGIIGQARMRDFLFERGKTILSIGLPGDIPSEMLLQYMEESSPDALYMLWASFHGDHVVICKGGTIVHNPGWTRGEITGPLSVGSYVIMAIVDI